MLQQARHERSGVEVTAFDRALAIGAAILLACVLVAIGRGEPHWATVALPVWVHLGTIIPALALTPLMLLRPRGDRLHRRLGYVWVALMAATALASFTVRTIRPGHFSPIHLLSLYTLAMLPMIVIAARRHEIVRHRRAVRGMVLGALLIAGFFTFPFNRLLGRWLFG